MDFLLGEEGGRERERERFGEDALFCKVGNCLANKKKGDLGVKNLSILNKALLCKWSWHFALERESLLLVESLGRKEESGVPMK